MAKKTTSYAPNMGLIGGEAQVAASLNDAGANVKAFTDAFSGALAIGVLENKKRDATINKYIDSIGSVANVSKIEDATNKQQITDFVRGQRDKADVIGTHLERNPDDREARDRLEAIKTSLSTLNAQLEAFTTEKKDYLKIHSDGGLADATTYTAGYYDNAFTNNGMFNIDENGNIGHNIDGTNYLYKDETGKYNVKNQLSIDYLGTAYDTQRNLGKTDEAFDRDQVRRGIAKHFNSQEIGTEGIQVMATQDLTEDDTFLLADGVTVAGNMSFRQMWADGHLKEEFYAGFEKDKATGMYGVGWMTDDAGKDQLVKLMSKYYTDVMEDGHSGGVEMYGVKKKKDDAVTAQKNEVTRQNSLDQDNAYAVYDGSGSVTYEDADEDYAVGDTRITEAEMNVIFGEYWNEGMNFGDQFKLGSDGIMYHKGRTENVNGELVVDEENWVEMKDVQVDGETRYGRERYNKIIEALQADGVKNLATTDVPKYIGTNAEVVNQRLKEFNYTLKGKKVGKVNPFNVVDTFKQFGINPEKFGRKKGAEEIKQLLNSVFHSKTFNKKFKFWSDEDNLKMEYTDGNGKKHTKSVETNNKTWLYGEHKGEDKESFNNTIKWMEDRIRADKGYWDSDGTIFEENNKDFVQ